MNVIKIIDGCLSDDINDKLIKLAKFYEFLESKKQDNVSFHSKFGILNENHKEFNLLKDLFKKELLVHLSELENKSYSGLADNCDDPKIKQVSLEEIKSWCLIQRKFGYCSPHTHFFVQWSCIYYCEDISLPEPQGRLEVIDPKVIGSLGNFRSETFSITPKKRRMVILPAFLVHYTHVILEDFERICYVCDFNIKEVF